MWLLADWMSNGMLLAGILLLILILFRRSYRHQRRQNRPCPDPASRPKSVRAADRVLSEPPVQVTQWQVEMHELARTLKAELDTKMRLLQLLIGQARVESERLEQLLAVGDPSRLSAGETVGSDRGGAVCEEIHPQQSAIYAMADTGHSPQEIAARLGAPQGEVEFVLSWRTSAPTAGTSSEG
ncbi:MAG: hypothetical protein ACYC0X_18345 [Pirellulaceae bacterium]